jgi:hypothetical protein
MSVVKRLSGFPGPVRKVKTQDLTWNSLYKETGEYKGY